MLQCAYPSTSHLTTEQTKGCAFADGMKDDLPVPLYTMITFHNFKVVVVMMYVYLCLYYSATVLV
jgi:aspartyl/asparaginyl beta-hydroxylase (cupin superfamily)